MEECTLNNEQLDNIIILNDEDGNQVNFEFIDLIEYDAEKYVVLLPVEDSDEPGEVVILKVESYGDEAESYISVDDENTLNTIFEIFKDKFKDEFDFVD